MNNQDLTVYTSALIDEIAQVGLSTCVISPGSRSTPLALLMAEHPDLRTYINVDERSAAFFALGAAKATEKPTVLACTSGSAEANYLPAVVEAAYSRVPLILLTADRPHELREVGAPQAINQMNMYSNYTRAYFEAAIPEDSEEMVRYARNLIRRAVAAALKPPAGPVQINLPIREPLIPDIADANLFTYGRSLHTPRIDIGKLSCSNSTYEQLAQELGSINKGIIVCGAQMDHEFAAAVIHLAEHLQFPILADPLSQLRLSGKSSEWIIDGYDAFLKSEKVVISLKPDVILRFGAMPVSKSFLQAVKKTWSTARQIVVDGGAEWRDPTGKADEMIYCDEGIFCQAIVDQVPPPIAQNSWSSHWRHINDVTRSVLATIRDQNGLSEGRIYYELNDILPDQSQLCVANSMPIRDIDTFIHQRLVKVDVLCNRGANGIDGTISTALGASITGKQTILITGDLSFFHDLNGLAATQLNELSLTIILINNNGGGIFSFLPQAESPNSEKQFERLFLTPLNLPFIHAAKLYGAEYALVNSVEQLQLEVNKGIGVKGVRIIEIQTDREQNVQQHRALWTDVVLEVEKYLEEIKA